MPVVISLYNAFTGLRSASRFVQQNVALIVPAPSVAPACLLTR